MLQAKHKIETINSEPSLEKVEPELNILEEGCILDACKLWHRVVFRALAKDGKLKKRAGASQPLRSN